MLSFSPLIASRSFFLLTLNMEVSDAEKNADNTSNMKMETKMPKIDK